MSKMRARAEVTSASSLAAQDLTSRGLAHSRQRSASDSSLPLTLSTTTLHQRAMQRSTMALSVSAGCLPKAAKTVTVASPSRRASKVIRTAQKPNRESLLHPLTCQHNRQLASSTGTLVVGEKHRDQGCLCSICCSPRGAWRRDELEHDIQSALECIRGNKDKSRLDDSMSSDQQKSKVRLPVAPPLLSPRSLGRQFRGGVKDKDCNADSSRSNSPMATRALQRTQPQRPASAPLQRKCPKETALQRLQVLARKTQKEVGFVQRCRQAWEAKEARAEERQRSRAEVPLAEARLRQAEIDKEERQRRWVVALHATFATQSFREVVLASRTIRTIEAGPDLVQKAVEELGGRSLVIEPKNSPSGRAHRVRRSAAIRRLLLARSQRKCQDVVQLHDVVAVARDPRRMGKQRIVSLFTKAIQIVTLFPWLHSIVLAGEACDWDSITEDLSVALLRKRATQARWSTYLLVGRFLGKLMRLRCRHKSADYMKKFVHLLIVHNRLNIGLKNSLARIRQVQRSLRAWISKETTKRHLIAQVLTECEDDQLMKRFMEECRSLLKQEKKRLRGLRVKKEKMSCERVIAITQENLQRYKAPKTNGDRLFVTQQLERYRMPREVMAACVQCACEARKTLISRSMAVRARAREVYEREKQTWSDIEQAVQLIDPSGCNPAPKPVEPTHKSIGFLIAPGQVHKITRRLRQWCETNTDDLQTWLDQGHLEEADGRSQDQVVVDVRAVISGVVREVVLGGSRL